MAPAGLGEDDNDEPLPIIEEPELDAAEREQLYQEVSSNPYCVCREC
jgi:hypothetical protein